MTTDTTPPHTTVGKTKFYQGEGQTDSLFCLRKPFPGNRGNWLAGSRCLGFWHRPISRFV